MKKIDIKSLSYKELEEHMIQLGEKSFRSKQIYDWLHVKLAETFDEMTNVSAAFREKLKEEYRLTKLELIDQRISKDNTVKYLFRLQDDKVVESVLMKYRHGNSVCISSQVGCKMGCHFCASAIGGLERDLTVSEMLEQVYRIQRISGERVSNVVVMGMGEPLDNYDNLIGFIKQITDDFGLHISQRNITISTCGLVDKMKALAEEGLTITMAISLHASNDDTRKKLMPIANKYSIKEIIEAAKYYFEKTNRRITFEYSLVDGINDSEEAARELVKLVRHLPCHINLIPVNSIKEKSFIKSKAFEIRRFQNILEKNHINVTIRREKGADIDAACGQLRKNYLKGYTRGEET